MVSSWLKIWTIWRSDCESKILNTKVPAGNTPQPTRWTPGISTGLLNVIMVFLFDSSAFALGAIIALANAIQETVVIILNRFIFIFSFCGTRFAWETT